MCLVFKKAVSSYVVTMASITIFFKPIYDTSKQKTSQSGGEREKTAFEKTVEKTLPDCREKRFIQEELSKQPSKGYCKVPASIEVAQFAAVRGATAAAIHFNKKYEAKYKFTSTRQTVQGWIKTYRKKATAIRNIKLP